MDDDQTPWLRLALCPHTPPSLLRELLGFPAESRHQVNQALLHWFADSKNAHSNERLSNARASMKSVARSVTQKTTQHQIPLNLPDEFDTAVAWQKLARALLSPKVGERIDQVRQWQAAGANRHLLTPAHPAWPNQLHTLPDPPALLYVHGNPRLLAMDQVAMVGARKSSVDGRRTAFELAKELSERGWLITSGLAQGIDTEAHKGCLAGNSPTIAVMATDATQIYPKANRALAAEILTKQGCLITETPLGMPLERYCFPRRNRLISALSQGVVVVEAAIKSGTITTARHAANQGREVMAVPGSVRNPNAAGCHELIRDGAAIVTSAADVMHSLPACRNDLSTDLAGDLSDKGVRKNLEDTAQSASSCSPMATNHGTDAKQVATLLEAMGYDAAPLERLVAHTGWSAAELVTLLTQLELQGKVMRDLAGRYSRC